MSKQICLAAVFIESLELRIKKENDMKRMHGYDSASVALSKLTADGYTVDYNTEFDHLVENSSAYTIDYLFRHEGSSDPDDESSVYGIRNRQTGQKGVFVAGNLSFLEGKKRDIILALELDSRDSDNGDK